MKRCPECEFVYEDEQQSCDMDGAELVHDLRFLAENLSFHNDLTLARPTEPELNNEATSLLIIRNSSPPQTPRYWPRLGGVAIAAAVLSTALSLAYITSNQSAPSDGRVTLTEAASESASATTPKQVEDAVAPAETSSTLPASGIETSAIELGKTPTGIDLPKATPRAQISQGRRGHRNHRSDSGEPTSKSRSKIVGPVTTVTTVRMTDKGAAISTRSDGPAQTTLKAPSIAAKSAPARTEKKESRVGSFLRTTGRILKKPFK